MWSEETSWKVVKWGGICFLMTQGMLAYLSVDKDYIPRHIGDYLFFVSIGVMGVILIQYLFATKGKDRIHLFLGIVFSAIYFLFRDFL